MVKSASRVMAFDFDGPIHDIAKTKSVAAYDLFGKWIPGHLLETSRLAEAGIEKEDYRKIQRYCYEDPGGIRYMHATAGAIAGLQRLARNGNKLIIVTARQSDVSLGLLRKFLTLRRLKTIEVFGVGYEESRVGAKRLILTTQNAHAYVEDDRRQVELLVGSVDYLYFFNPAGDEIAPEGSIHVREWKTLMPMLSDN